MACVKTERRTYSCVRERWRVDTADKSSFYVCVCPTNSPCDIQMGMEMFVGKERGGSAGKKRSEDLL